MFHPTVIAGNTPPAVHVFVSRVSDTYLADVHAMLRLPRPEVDITEGCNFSIVAVLMNVVSGASVGLYAPPPNRKETGRKFKETLRTFYPWNTEPAGAINNPDEGAEILYSFFRNPMAHAFGFQDPEPPGPVTVTRFPPPGTTEATLHAIETAAGRPV